MDGFAVVVAAIIAAFGGIWLDRSFQELDRRRDLYLEVLDYHDNIGVLIKEHLVAGTATLNTTMNEIERQINTMNAKLSLLASENVREKLNAYREALPAVLEAMKSAEPTGTPRDFRDELSKALSLLDPERSALAEAMRKDLKQRIWRRRKV